MSAVYTIYVRAIVGFEQSHDSCGECLVATGHLSDVGFARFCRHFEGGFEYFSLAFEHSA